MDLCKILLEARGSNGRRSVQRRCKRRVTEPWGRAAGFEAGLKEMNESSKVLTMMFIKYPGRIKLTQLSIERYHSLRKLSKCRGERYIDEMSFPMSFALTLFHHPGEPLNPLLQIYIVRRQASGVREWRTRLCRTYELMVQPWNA